MEREANTFVDELLMPTEFILWNKLKAKSIVEIYEVSSEAAYNKISFLKANALYKPIQEEIEAIRYHQHKYAYSAVLEDDNNRMVKKLRDAWLDPDYEFGGM